MLAILEEKIHLIPLPMEWRRKMGGLSKEQKLSKAKFVPKSSENRAFSSEF
jgi:hypothetical protein